MRSLRLVPSCPSGNLDSIDGSAEVETKSGKNFEYTLEISRAALKQGWSQFFDVRPRHSNQFHRRLRTQTTDRTDQEVVAIVVAEAKMMARPKVAKIAALRRTDRAVLGLYRRQQLSMGGQSNTAPPNQGLQEHNVALFKFGNYSQWGKYRREYDILRQSCREQRVG